MAGGSHVASSILERMGSCPLMAELCQPGGAPVLGIMAFSPDVGEGLLYPILATVLCPSSFPVPRLSWDPGLSSRPFCLGQARGEPRTLVGSGLVPTAAMVWFSMLHRSREGLH